MQIARRNLLQLEKTMAKLFRNAIFALPLLFVLAGCAAQETAPADPGVEDITPGQKSVIAAPSGQRNEQPRVEERNI